MATVKVGFGPHRPRVGGASDQALNTKGCALPSSQIRKANLGGGRRNCPLYNRDCNLASTDSRSVGSRQSILNT